MNWASWGAFWDMGGKAFYVWGSYAVTLALMIVEVAMLFQRRRSVRRQIGVMKEMAEGEAQQ